MLVVSVAEQALQTPSNPFLVFVFCNLIIIVIRIRARSGASSQSRNRGDVPVLGLPSDVKRLEIDNEERFPSDWTARSSCHDKQREQQKVELAEDVEENEDDGRECGNREENSEGDDKDGDNEYDGEEDYDDNELRTRIEDFIAKVNREWKADHLKEMLRGEPLALVSTSAYAPL